MCILFLAHAFCCVLGGTIFDKPYNHSMSGIITLHYKFVDYKHKVSNINLYRTSYHKDVLSYGNLIFF